MFEEFVEFKPSKRSLRKLKDKDLYETVEEVFDSTTLLTLYDIMKKGIVKKVYGVISAGKEARVYWGKGRNNEDLAIKIYLTSTAEFRRSIIKYIVGDPRFENIPLGNIRKIIYLWTRKEYRNLKRLYEAGVRVPKPIYFAKNILVMEFIGKEGIRAPLLREVDLSVEEAYKILNTILEYIKIMYNKARLVHADLSEYNIMLHNDEVVIIDVGQAVDISHPNALEFLKHDVETILRYFRTKIGLEDIPSTGEVLEMILKWRNKK